jgi:hypothetical protein
MKTQQHWERTLSFPLHTLLLISRLLLEIYLMIYAMLTSHPLAASMTKIPSNHSLRFDL